MTISVTFTGTSPAELFDAVSKYQDWIVDNVENNAAPITKLEPEKKTRKVKEEKVAEPKAEVLAPEKPKYTLQDAIDRAREIAGDGKDEKIMNALKGINTRLGISKVREIPPEKLDGYMKELNAEFPKDVATSANMFD